MTPAEAIELIKDCAKWGRVAFEDHALDQMEDRNISREDVFCALESARECEAEAKGRWKVTGDDAWGDDLRVIVAINGAVCVITIF